MSQLIHLKQRIQAVNVIKKITNAMRITAMSTHSKMNHQLVFLKHYQEELNTLTTMVQAQQKKREKEPEISMQEKKLYIIIGSSRGLCGNFNNALVHFFNSEQKKDTTFDSITVGKKITDMLKETIHTRLTIDNFEYTTLNDIAEKLFLMTQHYTQVLFFYTKPKSFFIQQPTIHQLIPLEKNDQQHYSDDLDLYYWPEDSKQLLVVLHEEFLRFSIKNILFNSLYAEQAAIFNSMDNATRSAESLLTEMNIHYAKLRQEKITQELTELSVHFFKS